MPHPEAVIDVDPVEAADNQWTQFDTCGSANAVDVRHIGNAADE